MTLLGINYEERSEPFLGSSGVTHPLLSEAVTQFQAQAYKEMLPPGGPVKTQILGCLLYTSPSPRDGLLSRMPSSA